jgi:hypothetical protein
MPPSLSPVFAFLPWADNSWGSKAGKLEVKSRVHPPRRYIVKGTTSRLPGVALTEHLCMEVSRQAGLPTAMTEVSDRSAGSGLAFNPPLHLRRF